MPDAALQIAIASRAVAPLHGFGGLERAVASQVRHLAARGVRVTVFTQPAYANAPPPDQYGGLVTWRQAPFHTSRLPLRRNSILDRLVHYGAWSRQVGALIVDLARQERLDVVEAQGLAGAGYARELRRAGARLPPLVLNPHGMEEFSRRNLAKALAYTPIRRGVRAAAAAAAAVISTDQALDSLVARNLGVPPSKIVTIPNGVDVAALDALVDLGLARTLRERYGLSGSPLTLLSVARIERNKGLAKLLAALAALREQLPAGWRWLHVGAGSQEARLRASIAEHGFAANVSLVGALSDSELHSLLESADLFLVPSLYEGSSLAALEGMVHRLPVVATTAGGLPDKVLPGATGFLAPPGDVPGLRDALAAALAARAAWPELGRAGRALVEARFDWSRIVEQYLDLYRQLRQ